MKKLQLLTGALLVASSVFAQKAEVSKEHFITKKAVKKMTSEKSVSIWSDDFSDPTTWEIDHDASACALDWEIGTNLECGGSYPIATIASTTYDNGCAMVDSDEYGGEEGGSDIEDSWITTANPIDLSAYNNVVLQFETWYRSYNSEKCFIVTSTNNTDWPDLTPDFDASTNPNVYEAFPGISGVSGEEMPSNPTEWRLNISPSAGGESQVWVRFHWTGTWGYAWFIDDVAIIEQPANDIVLNSAWVSNTDGVEYGRTPENHVADSLVLGGEIFNFGINAQNNISLDMSVTDASGNVILSEMPTTSALENDSTVYLQNPVTDFTLSEGTYTFNAVSSSDADNANGANANNNSYTRNFEITKNVYSLDGLGVYDNDMLNTGYVGTNYGNGTIVLARYVLREETTVQALEIALASFTDAGGQIFTFLVAEDVLLEEDVDMSTSNRIAENEDGMTIEQSHIDDGIITVPLTETTIAAGTYYVCAELYNGQATEDDRVYIIDDETVAQPGGASMIFTADDGQAWSNGNAAAIRLVIAEPIGIEENSTELFSVSPNPSNGVFTVNAEKIDNYTLEVVNVLGAVVSTKTVEGSLNETVDLSNFDAGIYLVKVSTSTLENVQRIVIK